MSMTDLRSTFGARLKMGEPMARHTSARVGGPADYLATAESAGELAELVRAAWRLGLQPLILGGGSNVLVGDAGVRGLVILNRARALEFRPAGPGRPASGPRAAPTWACWPANAGCAAWPAWSGPPRCQERWAGQSLATPARTAATWPAIWSWPKSCNKMMGTVCGDGTRPSWPLNTGPAASSG